jgi:hypothetical protein
MTGWAASLACGLVILASLGSGAAAKEVCLTAPYDQDAGELSDLTRLLILTLAPHPSLAAALEKQAPTFCLDDSLYSEQGYYEPETNRIVLRSGLGPDFQLAILVHEIRHLEQFGRDVCPTIGTTLTDYIRSRLALEADAAAIGVYVAWTLREAGRPGPWDRLQSWPTHDDLVGRFAAEIANGADEVQATAATFAQWFESRERREIYAFAICSNYLDALDREKVPASGWQKLPDDYAERLCVMPDGRPYDCALPP